jgi:hypothetical protein
MLRNSGSAASCAVSPVATGWLVAGSTVRVHRIALFEVGSPAATPLNTDAAAAALPAWAIKRAAATTAAERTAQRGQNIMRASPPPTPGILRSYWQPGYRIAI